MKQLFRTKKQSIDLEDVYLASLTDKNEIQTLMYKLHPILSGKELIRLGSASDGGYLLPDDLDGIEACFSAGVGEMVEFEKGCADLGMKIFLADKSVDCPPELHEKFYFIPKLIGATTNDDFMTLDDWVAVSLPNSGEDLLLQIDTEGYEYETFLCTSNHLIRRFRIIIAEFHSLDLLWNQPFFKLASRAFEKILQTHTCVHIHPNNYSGSLNKRGLEIPVVAEFTFLRNDRISSSVFANSFPHPLDCDNDSIKNPPLSLPKCWYRAED